MFCFWMMTCEFLHTLEYIQVSIKVPIFTCFVQLLPSSNWYTPRNLTWNLKMMVSKRNLLFQGLLFRFHVKFQGVRFMSCLFYWFSNIAEVPLSSYRKVWRSLCAPFHPKMPLSSPTVLSFKDWHVSWHVSMAWLKVEEYEGAWGWWMNWRMKVKVSLNWMKI